MWTWLTLYVKVDVIDGLSAVRILNDTDVVTTIRFLSATDEQWAVLLLSDGARQRASILGPSRAKVPPRHVTAKVYSSSHMRELLIIMGLHRLTTQLLYG